MPDELTNLTIHKLTGAAKSDFDNDCMGIPFVLALMAAVSIAVLLWFQSPVYMWVAPVALIGIAISAVKHSEKKCWAAQISPEHLLLKGFGADHTIPYREILSVRLKMGSSNSEELVFRTASGKFLLNSKVIAANSLIQEVRDRIMPREPLIFEAEDCTPMMAFAIAILVAIFAGFTFWGHAEGWGAIGWAVVPLILLIGYTASKQVTSVKVNHSGLTVCTTGRETSVRWHEISKYTPPTKNKPGMLKTEHGDFNLPGTVEGYDELSQIILNALICVNELPPDSGAMLFIEPSSFHQKRKAIQKKA